MFLNPGWQHCKLTVPSQCDGKRPTCTGCGGACETCIYGGAQNETHYTALKRSHQDLEEDYSGLLELFRYLRTRSEAEATSILHRLRSGAHLSSVLSFIKDGDLLLQVSSRQQGDSSGALKRSPTSFRPEHSNTNAERSESSQCQSLSVTRESDFESNAVD